MSDTPRDGSLELEAAILSIQRADSRLHRALVEALENVTKAHIEDLVTAEAGENIFRKQGAVSAMRELTQRCRDADKILAEYQNRITRNHNRGSAV